MEAIKEYVFSVLCAALICGILSSISRKNFAGQVIKLLCGVYLAITLIQPVYRIDLSSALQISLPQFQDGKDAASVGQHMAQTARSDIIKAETEAYILDKAELLTETVSVEVLLDPSCIPSKIVLSGNISEDGKRTLETILEADLGITKENQIWIGQN